MNEDEGTPHLAAPMRPQARPVGGCFWCVHRGEGSGASRGHLCLLRALAVGLWTFPLEGSDVSCPVQPACHSSLLATAWDFIQLVGFRCCQTLLLPRPPWPHCPGPSLRREQLQEEMQGRPREEAPVTGPQEGLGRRPRPGAQARKGTDSLWPGGGSPMVPTGGRVDGALLWNEQATPQLHPCLQGGGKQPARCSVSARPQLQPHQSMW